MARSYSTLGGVVHTLSDGCRVSAYHDVNVPGAPIRVQVEVAPRADRYTTGLGNLFYSAEEADAFIDGLEPGWYEGDARTGHHPANFQA